MPQSEKVTALDTSVIVAALMSWHRHHEPAREYLDQLFASGETILLPVKALVEAYSVMTRLPAPHRLSPEVAAALLERNLSTTARLIELPGERYWDFLGKMKSLGVAGGAVYDAEILECSLQADADSIATLNRRHFERWSPPGLQIVTPDDTSSQY